MSSLVFKKIRKHLFTKYPDPIWIQRNDKLKTVFHRLSNEELIDLKISFNKGWGILDRKIRVVNVFIDSHKKTDRVLWEKYWDIRAGFLRMQGVLIHSLDPLNNELEKRELLDFANTLLKQSREEVKDRIIILKFR